MITLRMDAKAVPSREDFFRIEKIINDDDEYYLDNNDALLNLAKSVSGQRTIYDALNEF